MPPFIRQITRHRLTVPAAIAALTVLAVAVRLPNISSYKFYPDSYQNLIVARNLADYHQVLGFLGPNGMVYPDFLGWTRPVYSWLMLIPGLLGMELTAAASLIAVICGVLAVPAAYLAVTAVLRSRPAGVVAALFIALSANHIAWGGFILTETTGVLALLLFVWALFAARNQPAPTDWRPALAGALMGLVTLTRYEYAVVAAPAAWLLWRSTGCWRQLAYFFGGMVGVLVASAWLYRGVLENMGRVLAELAPLAGVVIAAMAALVLAWLVVRRHSQRLRQWAAPTLIGVLWLAACAIAVRAIVGWQVPTLDLTAWADFFAMDFVIGLAALMGLTLMLRRPTHFERAIFVIVSMVLLAAVYYRVNPAMQRYVTHELPFLIIPAAYSLHVILNWGLGRLGPANHGGRTRAIAVFGLVIFLLGAQAVTAYRGIHHWSGGLWFQTGYEERAARQLAPQLPGGVVLITSLPEPYYLFTGRATHSLAPAYPHLHMPNVGAKQKVAIVQDAGMRHLFPQFSQILDTRMQGYKTDEFWVRAPFRYQAEAYPETKPVVVYQTTLETLRHEIANDKLNASPVP